METTVCPLLVCLTEDMCMGIASDERDDNDRQKISLYGKSGGAGLDNSNQQTDAKHFETM